MKERVRGPEGNADNDDSEAMTIPYDIYTTNMGRAREKVSFAPGMTNDLSSGCEETRSYSGQKYAGNLRPTL